MNSKLKKLLIDFLSTTLVCGLLIYVDVLTKKWAYTDLVNIYGGKKEFLPRFLSFQYAENTGAAWSMLSEQPWIFISISIIVILGILYYIFFGNVTNLLLRFSLLFLLSGGIGNMIDRLFRTGSHLQNRNGFVVDMLNFEFIDFPIFNFADVCVCIGAGLLILYMIIFEFKSHTSKDKENNE